MPGFRATKRSLNPLNTTHAGAEPANLRSSRRSRMITRTLEGRRTPGRCCLAEAENSPDAQVAKPKSSTAIEVHIAPLKATYTIIYTYFSKYYHIHRGYHHVAVAAYGSTPYAIANSTTSPHLNGAFRFFGENPSLLAAACRTVHIAGNSVDKW